MADLSPATRSRLLMRPVGARLAPSGFRGLLILATGRRLMQSVNIDDYLEQANEFEGTWPKIALLTEHTPPVFLRLLELQRAGYKLQLP